MFDSHCHLDFDELSGSLSAHLERGRRVGVEKWFVPGCHPETWPRLGRLADPDIHFGVGLHPYFADEPSLGDDLGEELERAALELGAVAIGETGLDKHRGPPEDVQARLFEIHLEVAGKLELPIVIHQVGHQKRLLDCLKRVGLSAAGGVVHGFGGDASWAKALTSRGLHLGIGHFITNPSRRKVREAAATAPSDRLMIETDAPDQAPYGSGSCGVPADLKRVTFVLSELRGQDEARIAQQTAETARCFFGLGQS